MTALADPFDVSEVEFRVGSTNRDGTRGMALTYITARAVMNRLDECCGVWGWSDAYSILPDGKHVECRLTLNADGVHVSRSDVGEPNEGGFADSMKSAYSDAFKRAAVKFGIGRYLYSLGESWVPVENKRITDAGLQMLYTQYERTVFGTPSTTAPVHEPIARETPQSGLQRGSERPAPRPSARPIGGGVAITQFWKAAKALGFEAPEVLQIAGGSIAGWTDEQLDGLLAELKDRKGGVTLPDEGAP